MPEPLQWLQCCTLVPGSWPLPSQRWHSESTFSEISLLTPFAACVNVSSMMYCKNTEKAREESLWIRAQKNKQKKQPSSYCLALLLMLNLTYLLWLFKYCVVVSKAPSSWEFSKYFTEKLLWVHAAGLSTPVVLPSFCLTSTKVRWAVCVILLPLCFITKNLKVGKIILQYINKKCHLCKWEL